LGTFSKPCMCSTCDLPRCPGKHDIEVNRDPFHTTEAGNIERVSMLPASVCMCMCIYIYTCSTCMHLCLCIACVPARA
jgi:hypothetical protein